MKIGDIYLVEIPSSNGHEQAGMRPGILMQDADSQLPTVLIIPLTSKLMAQAFPGTTLVQPNAANGLTTASVALVFQLRAIDKRRLKHKIGQLNAKELKVIQAQVKLLMKLK